MFETVSLIVTRTPARLSRTSAATVAEVPPGLPSVSEAMAAAWATLFTRASSALASVSSRAAVRAAVSAAFCSWARRCASDAYSSAAPAPTSSTGSAKPKKMATPPRWSRENRERRRLFMAPF
jgi:hypothetical protein